MTEVGEAGLDGLVNNAGIAVTAPLETMPLEDLRRQLEVNLISQVAVTQAMLPLDPGRPRPHRLPQLDRRADRVPATGPYHASKYGIEAVVDFLRQELRPWKISSRSSSRSRSTPRSGSAASAARTGSANGTRRPGRSLRKDDEALRGGDADTAERGIAPEKVAGRGPRPHARCPRIRYLVGPTPRGRRARGSWCRPAISTGSCPRDAL